MEAEQVTILDRIKEEKGKFVDENGKKPTMIVMDPYTAADVKHSMGLTDLDELNSYLGMKIVYSLDESTFRLV